LIAVGMSFTSLVLIQISKALKIISQWKHLRELPLTHLRLTLSFNVSII
jgi:hypothetical protein